MIRITTGFLTTRRKFPTYGRSAIQSKRGMTPVRRNRLVRRRDLFEEETWRQPFAVMTSALDKYAAGKSRTIKGWLSRIDAEILKTILTAQNVGGLAGSV